MKRTNSSIKRRNKMIQGTLTVFFGTFFSRILGMLRDMATATVFGMSAGGVMDSFVVAFRLPDIARRLFGDGTISISFIPEFTKVWHSDRKKAWALLSATLFYVFLFLTCSVFCGEILCWTAITIFSPESKFFLTAHLISLLLPYLILICMAAIASATLQTLGNFTLPAMIPIILNITWLAGILFVVPVFSDEPAVQCYILTLCILFAGTIQFFIHVPLLRRYGFIFDYRFTKVRQETKNVFEHFFPQMFGLMPTQLNILTASGIAWLFTGQAGETIWWLGNQFNFPVRTGAVSAIYFSERLYEFPQGLIGWTIAAAIYPLLNRHYAKKDSQSFGEDLSLGLRMVFVFAIPAGAGLMLFSENLIHLLFQRGTFSANDAARTADMVFWFGTGVWAFCVLPVLIRAFYVISDIKTPCQVGLFCCSLNVMLCVFFLWKFKEQGLAVSASVSAGIQAVLLFLIFGVKHGYLNYKSIIVGILRACFATVLMSFAVDFVLETIPGQDSWADLVHLLFGGLVAVFVFLVVNRFLGGRELSILLRRKETSKIRQQHTKKRNKR